MPSYIVGRDPRTCDIVTPEAAKKVSRQHVRLTTRSDGRYTIEDLASSGGTFVKYTNGWTRISKQIVGPDDELALANYRTSVRQLFGRLRSAAAVETVHQQSQHARPRRRKETRPQPSTAQLAMPILLVFCLVALIGLTIYVFTTMSERPQLAGPNSTGTTQGTSSPPTASGSSRPSSSTAGRTSTAPSTSARTSTPTTSRPSTTSRASPKTSTKSCRKNSRRCTRNNQCCSGECYQGKCTSDAGDYY